MIASGAGSGTRGRSCDKIRMDTCEVLAGESRGFGNDDLDANSPFVRSSILYNLSSFEENVIRGPLIETSTPAP
jgi:hypothetical protein